MRLETTELFKKELSRAEGLHELTQEELSGLRRIVRQIAEDLMDLCEQEKIPYVLGGGSCLGAVRHKGMIPWDDDIDLNIPRSQIERLCTLVEERYPDRYRVIRPLVTPGYYSTFYQVQKKNTVFREYRNQTEENCGVKVDLFVYENTPDNRLLRKLHGFLCDGGSFLLSCIRAFRWRKEFMELTEGNDRAKKTMKIKALLGALPSLTPSFWYRRVMGWHRMCRRDTSQYISCPSGRRHYFGELQERRKYWDTKAMAFEQRMAQVPGNYQEYLTGLYGPDYMVPPKADQIEKHVLYELKL